MKNRATKLIALILAVLMMFTALTACRDVTVDVETDDVNVGVGGTGIDTGNSQFFTVEFVDWDGTILDTQSNIPKGGAATTPGAPTRAGYTFVRWDKEFYNVTSNLVVKALYEKNTEVACDHEAEYTEAKDAACEVNGNIEYWHCNKCGKYFDDEDLTGEIKKSDTIISKLGHIIVIDEAIAPTYEKEGRTEGSHCSVCGKIEVTPQVIPKLKANHYSITYKNIKTATIAVEYTSYSENQGFDLPENITVDGYKFEGWYTKPEGGEKVVYIEKGSTEDYVLYAHWSLVEYTITYIDAPTNNNPAKYTIEDELVLKNPEWSGLKFTGWTDDNGNTIDRISTGTIGNIELTANWKRLQNLAVQNTNNDALMVIYNEEMEKYHFIYEIGTIEHVVLDRVAVGSTNLKYNSQAVDLTFTLSNIVSIEDSIAEAVAKTISSSVSKSSGWSESKEWAKSHSETRGWESELSLSVGFEAEIKKIHKLQTAIQASHGQNGSETDENSWGEAVSQSGSASSGSEQSSSVSSSISYKKQISNEVTTNINISKEMPEGYYSYVHAGNIRVYAIVSYDPITKDYYLDTYSMIDNMHEMMLYYRDVTELNSNSCETLKFDIPCDRIEDYLASSLYTVKFDKNGGTGSMPNAIFGTDVKHILPANNFSRTGYIFSGWKVNTSSVATILRDKQEVTDLAGEDETVTLKAVWTPISYNINYAANTGSGTTPGSVHIYDNLSKLSANNFSKAGYTFAGWNTSADGTGTAYSDNEYVKNLTASSGRVITLYAQWQAVSYTIRYDANKPQSAKYNVQNLPSDATWTYNTNSQLANQPTLALFEFGGWYKDKECIIKVGNANETLYYANLADSQGATVTLYAKWIPVIEKTFTISDFYVNYNDELQKDITGYSDAFDINYLKAAGYKMSVRWSFTCVNDDNQGYVATYLIVNGEKAILNPNGSNDQQKTEIMHYSGDDTTTYFDYTKNDLGIHTSGAFRLGFSSADDRGGTDRADYWVRNLKVTIKFYK